MRAERVQHNLPVSSIQLTGLTADSLNTDNMSTVNTPTANSTIADVDDIVFHHLCRLDADCTNDVIENMIFDVDKDLLAESREAMLNEAVERCCQDMIAKGEFTSHPNFVLTKHDGPNATAMMAKDIVMLYVYATRQTGDFPNLKSPSKAPNNVDQDTINVPIEKEIRDDDSATTWKLTMQQSLKQIENMQRHVSNMSQTIIESDEVTSCDISNSVNSIPETSNTVRSTPNTYPESPVFPKHTIQRENKLHYGITKSEKENEQPVLDVYFSDTADKDNTPNRKKNKSHEISNKEDEDLHRSPKDCSRLIGLEQKLQKNKEKNTKLVEKIRGKPIRIGLIKMKRKCLS